MKGFIRTLIDEVNKKQIFIKCNKANCINSKNNYCNKCNPIEVEIDAEGKCNCFEIINNTYELETGNLIDITKEYKCPTCSKTLEFKWESARSQRKIATCCHKKYSIIPSNYYKIESIEDDPYYL